MRCIYFANRCNFTVRAINQIQQLHLVADKQRRQSIQLHWVTKGCGGGVVVDFDRRATTTTTPTGCCDYDDSKQQLAVLTYYADFVLLSSRATIFIVASVLWRCQPATQEAAAFPGIFADRNSIIIYPLGVDRTAALSVF